MLVQTQGLPYCRVTAVSYSRTWHLYPGSQLVVKGRPSIVSQGIEKLITSSNLQKSNPPQNHHVPKTACQGRVFPAKPKTLYPKLSTHPSLLPKPPKVCKIMAFMAIILGLGLLFYILLGFRYSYLAVRCCQAASLTSRSSFLLLQRQVTVQGLCCPRILLLYNP